MAFVEDSLLRANGLTHHGEHVAEDEELTPTLENSLVLTWLRLIHPSLPRLGKQRYGTELRSRTLASIKPEISQALSSLFEEIGASDDDKILRAEVADDFRRPRPGGRSDPKTRTRQPRQDKVCPLCKQAGRSNTNHFLSQCTFLPDNDRRFMVKARQIFGILDDEQAKTPTTTLILIHPVLKPLCLPLTLLPTVIRPVNLLIWMSFMVTVLYVSPSTAEQLEI